MKRTVFCLIFILCLAAAVCAAAEGTLTLFAVNVRKADCLLLFSGQDVYMIDTGSAESWGQVSAALKSYQITGLKGVIVTHTDDDHTGGLTALASSSVEVEHWYASAYYADVKTSKHPVKLAAASRGQSVEWLKGGDELPLDGGSLRVLGPLTDSETENCNSLVLLAEGGGGSMLLTGDMEFDEEDELLNAGLIPACTVLKVANHGESDATGSALMRAVRPQIAVISTNSDDERDTPATRVLKVLHQYNASIWLTENAQAGVLVQLTDGNAAATLTDWGNLPDEVTGIVLADKDRENQSIRVENRGTEDADLSGCFIYSERGGETFVFPEGTLLKAGESVTVAAENSPLDADYVWQETKVWAKNKEDAAQLCDVWGRLLDRLE